MSRGIVGRWTHAHERDTDRARVFVGPEVRLGLSRGRRVLEFDENGAFVETRPGPDDRSKSRAGRYRVADGVLVLEHADGTVEQYGFETTESGELRLSRQ